jgi:phage terminase small subunit
MSEALKLWNHLFADERGTLAVWSGERCGEGINEPSTKYFDYPAATVAAAEHARKESEIGREAYFCTHLLTARKRIKDNAAPVRTLWGEFDGPEVPNGSLKPTALVESSPGHRHAYWRLTDAIPPETAEALNKRIAAATDADPSGFDLSQLLRVPGTVNHKYQDLPVVRLIRLDGGHEYVPADLDNSLPVIEKASRNGTRKDGVHEADGASLEPPVALSPEALKVWRGEVPKLKKDGTVNRSSTLVKIGCALYDGGANRPVIVAALQERDEALGYRKYLDGRGDAERRCHEIVDELEESGRNPQLHLAKGAKTGGGAEGEDDKQERRNQADRLIAYARDALGSEPGTLFVDQHGAPHALVDGEPVALTSRCYSWLRRLMWNEESKAVNGEYLKTAAGTLSAHAEFSAGIRELHTRAAWLADEGALYYELRPGKVVRVDSGGWTFEPKPPVLFRRYPNLKPLPDPKPGGSVKDLAEYVNLKTNRDKRLFVSYVVTAALPHVARPIFNASGPMGAGKTTIGRIIKRLLDPTVPETVRYDPRDILQKAMHAYILMLDNLSSLSDAASDTFCRFVTGDGDSKRKLYTDDEDVIVELKRALIFNGINVPTDRGDVLDRMLPVELERIPDGDRKTEEQLWELFAQEHPRILGALFDTLSRALAAKPSLKLSRRPRLADWGEYAAAVYEVMGWGAEQFLKDWDEVVKAQNQGTLDGSPVAQAIIKFMEDKEEYTGTSSEIHKKLEGVAESLGVSIVRDKAWPKSARWLWRRIKEVLPLLAAAGIEASRDDTEKASVIAFRKVPTNDSSNSRIPVTPVDKGNTAGIKGEPDSSSNSSRASNSRNDSSLDSAYLSASGDTGITGDSYGNSSEALCKHEVSGGCRLCRQQIERLVHEGMSREMAREEILGEEIAL